MRLRLRPRRDLVSLSLAVVALIAGARILPAQQQAPAPRDTSVRAVVAGLVTDSAGTPVPDAEVILVDESRGMHTTENGLFQINRVPSGIVLIDVRRLGFKEQLVNLEVRPADTLRIHITLDMLATPLAPVIVEATRRRNAYYMPALEERRRMGIGSQMTREQIDSIPTAFTLVDLLRRLRGIELVPVSNGHYSIQTTRGSGQLNSTGRACTPLLYLDGVQMPDALNMVETLLASQVQAVESYIGPSEIPPEYLNMGNECGVVLIWTRHGK